MLAYDYPLMGVFWSMLWFFVWIMLLMMLFHVIADIFRSHDMNGLSKALWLILVLVLPFLGVFIYLIARGDSMGQDDHADARARDQAFRSSVSTGGSADELAKLAELRDRGVITEAEFAEQKSRVLA